MNVENMFLRSFDPIQTSSLSFRVKIKRYLWIFVNKTLHRYSPFFMRGWRRGLLRLFGASISHDASPDRKAIIDFPWNLTMKSKASIAEGCWIYALDKIILGENTCISRDVYILTGTHDVCSKNFDLIVKPVYIGDACWIATRSIVLPGISIGNGSVVAAGSVITKNVEPWTVVGGNPAKFIKKREITE